MGCGAVAYYEDDWEGEKVMRKQSKIPTVLGAFKTPNKVAISTKTNLGHELFICGIVDGNPDRLDGRIYDEILFCNIECLDKVIGVLQVMRDGWAKEIEDGKK